MTLVILLLLSLATAQILLDNGCSPGPCYTDPLTGAWIPLNVQFRYDQNNNVPPFVYAEKPMILAWLKANNISAFFDRPITESVRYGLETILEDGKTDVITWQAASPMMPYLADLTDMAARQNWSTRFDARMLKKVTFNGRIMAMPEAGEVWGIWYNVAEFAALHLTTPTTWEEFLFVLKTIKASGKAPICYGSADLWELQTWLTYLMMRLGGASYWDDVLAGGINFATDEVMYQAWSMWDEVMNGGYTVPPNSTASLNFLPDVANMFYFGQCSLILYPVLSTSIKRSSD